VLSNECNYWRWCSTPFRSVGTYLPVDRAQHPERLYFLNLTITGVIEWNKPIWLHHFWQSVGGKKPNISDTYNAFRWWIKFQMHPVNEIWLDFGLYLTKACTFFHNLFSARIVYKISIHVCNLELTVITMIWIRQGDLPPSGYHLFPGLKRVFHTHKWKMVQRRQQLWRDGWYKRTGTYTGRDQENSSELAWFLFV
jgi:hypothetical protein